MDIFGSVGNWFRGAFGGDTEAEKKKRQPEYQPQTPQIAVSAPKQPTLSVSTPQQPQMTVEQPKQPKPTLSVSQPKMFQSDMSTPQTISTPKPANPTPGTTKLKAIQLDEGKNKTIFGWNAAAFLPKSLEKTYGVGTKDVETTNDDFLKYYDSRNSDFQKAFVNKLKEQAYVKNKDGSVSVGDEAAVNTLKLLNDNGRFKGGFGDFLEGANDKLAGGLSRGALRTADFFLPGKNTLGLERLADQQDATKTGTNQVTTAGKAGEITGTIAKGATDLAAMAIPSAKAEELLKATRFVKGLEDGGKIAQYASKIVPNIAADLTIGNAVQKLQSEGNQSDFNLLENSGISLAAGAATPLIGGGIKGIRRLFGKGTDKAIEEGTQAALSTAAKTGTDTAVEAITAREQELMTTIQDAGLPAFERKKALQEFEQLQAQKTAQDAYKTASSAERGADNPLKDMQNIGANPGEASDIPAYVRRNGENLISDATNRVEEIDNTLRKMKEVRLKQQLAESIRAYPQYKDELIKGFDISKLSVNFDDLPGAKSLIDEKRALEEQVNRMTVLKQQSDKLDEMATQQANAVQEAQAVKQAATNPSPSTVVESSPAPAASPEVSANDAYQRFNQEAGITSGSKDVTYIDAQQQLEKLAGNKALLDESQRQGFRIPTAINENTQGAVADAVTNTVGNVTGSALQSQNSMVNTFGQILNGFNKKSTLNNAEKTIVEQVRGRMGGSGKIIDDLVTSAEKPLASLGKDGLEASKEKVMTAFLEYNNGNVDNSLSIIKSFSPEERSYFDNIVEMGKLRNNLNRETMNAGVISQFDNGMHMPRIYDMESFIKEFSPDDMESYIASQGKTLDLNPAKRRQQIENIAQDLQAKMLRDPAQANAIRLDIALHNKAVSEYSAIVGTIPDAVSDVPLKGYLPIPDSPRFGDAAGKFIRRDLAEPMLSGNNRFKSETYKAVNTILEKYQGSILGKIENGLRKGLTVYNPATRLGNRTANLAQGAMAGFNLPEMAVSQQHFMNVLKNGGDEWTRLAKTFGAIDNTDSLARISGGVNEPTGLFSDWRKARIDSYQNVDTAAKVAMFKWQIQRGAAPEAAARFVNRALPNIGNTGEVYSFFSRLPVLGTPFRAIQPEILRSLASTTGRNTVPFLIAMATYTTLQNSTWEDVPPEERQKIQERFGAGQTPFAGFNRFMGEHGIPTDKVLPSSWSFNAAGVPGVKELFATDPETGNRPVVDVDPRRLMGMYSINLGGDSMADSTIDTLSKVSPVNIPVSYNNGEVTFQPQNIVASRLFAPLWQAALDKDFRGKSVQEPDRNPNAVDPVTMQPLSTRDNPSRMFQYMLRSYVPQITDVSNIVDANAGRDNFYGQNMNVQQAVARLFGLKGEQFDEARLKKMDDQKAYFADLEQINKQLEGMTPTEQAAWKRLTGVAVLDQKKPNAFGGESWVKAPVYNFGEDKWKDYASNPRLYELMVQKKVQDNQRSGNPIQPEFDQRLSDSFRKQLIQNKMVAPGDDAELDQRMYSSPEWDYYQKLKEEYKAAAKAKYGEGDGNFTDELVKHQDAKFPDKPDVLKQYSAAYGLYANGKATKPEFTDAVKAAKDAYNKQTFDWTNTERKTRGLPAITWDVWNNPTFGFDSTPSSSGFGFGGGSNYNAADHVNTLTRLTNFSSDVSGDRVRKIDAQNVPNLANFFRGLTAGSVSRKQKPTIGASSSGR